MPIPPMNTLRPTLIVALIIAIVAAIAVHPYVYWAKSGYSEKSYLLIFDSEPSETALIDAIILKDAIPGITKHLPTCDTFMAIERHSTKMALRFCAHSGNLDPSVTLADGDKIDGVWLTEPATRIHPPLLFIQLSAFLTAFLGAMLMTTLARWVWYFLLARLTEVSNAIRK